MVFCLGTGAQQGQGQGAWNILVAVGVRTLAGIEGGKGRCDLAAGVVVDLTHAVVSNISGSKDFFVRGMLTSSKTLYALGSHLTPFTPGVPTRTHPLLKPFPIPSPC